MNCSWKELLAILPQKLRSDVDKLGREQGQELRLREGASPVLICGGEYRNLPGTVKQEDISFIINAASRYSPWASATTGKGYLTAQGGHRIGLCGDVVVQEGNITGFHRVRSLCIRIARDFPGIASPLKMVSGSVLILGSPGWGKTTLLRDLIRAKGENHEVSVVDERGELFPQGFMTGRNTDVLFGCPKVQGIEMVLRTMGPDYIAVDEITAKEDCEALLDAANCGVQLLATAHGSSVEDLKKRQLYQKLLENRVFHTCVVMSLDKSWRMERINYDG